MWTPVPLSNREIEGLANRLFGMLIQQVGQSYLLRFGLRFSDFYERVVLPTYGIVLHERCRLGSHGSTLGQYWISENAAKIDETLAAERNDPRRTFTLYHEVFGHGVLQGNWLRLQRQFPNREEPLVDNQSTLDFRNREALERQANAMAGFSAAPMWLVDRQLCHRLQLSKMLVYHGPGPYCLGSANNSRRFVVESFDDYCRCCARIIQPYFDGLSVEALGYRVRRSALVADRTRSVILRRSA